MSKLRIVLVPGILITLLYSHHAVMADFDPALKAALASVTAQRDTTMSLVFDTRARARKIENNSFPGRLPDSVPEYGFCRDASSGRFDDMRVAYRILDSIISSTAAASSIQDSYTHLS